MLRMNINGMGDAVARLLKDKQRVSATEQTMISGLNRVLRQLGYEIVRATDGDAARPRMSAARRKAIAKRMRAYWAKRKAAASKSATKRSRK